MRRTDSHPIDSPVSKGLFSIDVVDDQKQPLHGIKIPDPKIRLITRSNAAFITCSVASGAKWFTAAIAAEALATVGVKFFKFGFFVFYLFHNFPPKLKFNQTSI